MAPGDPVEDVRDVAADACYVLNFLAVDRIDLLVDCQQSRKVDVPLQV